MTEIIPQRAGTKEQTFPGVHVWLSLILHWKFTPDSWCSLFKNSWLHVRVTRWLRPVEHPTFDFGSGPELRVMKSSPELGFTLSEESVSSSLSVLLPALNIDLSLSQIQSINHFKKSLLKVKRSPKKSESRIKWVKLQGYFKMLSWEAVPFNQLRDTKNKSVSVLKGALPEVSPGQPLNWGLVPCFPESSHMLQGC